jgi:hypothetical protein
VTTGLTLLYDHGQHKYQLERAVAPDDQLWVDIGELIRDQVPDKDSNLLPASATSGAYSLRVVSSPLQTALYEGKVITDKTYGHATYGCMVCCGYRGVDFNVDPVDALLNGVTDFSTIGYNACGSGTSNVDGYMTSWWSSNTAIMTVQPQRATGASIGSTYVNAEAPNLPERGIYDGVSCPVQDTQDTGTANVGIPTIMTVAEDLGNFVNTTCPQASQNGLVRTITYQLSNSSGDVGAVRMQESFGNAVTNSCGNPPPTASSCFTVGSGGQFIDTLATNACGPSVRTCGIFITPDHWQYCGGATPVNVGSPTYSIEWIDININSSRQLPPGTLIP